MTGEEICRKLEDLKNQGANLEKLLSSAVELLHNSNTRFDWTGIYELFPDNVYAWDLSSEPPPNTSSSPWARVSAERPWPKNGTSTFRTYPKLPII